MLSVSAALAACVAVLISMMGHSKIFLRGERGLVVFVLIMALTFFLAACARLRAEIRTDGLHVAGLACGMVLAFAAAVMAVAIYLCVTARSL